MRTNTPLKVYIQIKWFDIKKNEMRNNIQMHVNSNHSFQSNIRDGIQDNFEIVMVETFNRKMNIRCDYSIE